MISLAAPTHRALPVAAVLGSSVVGLAVLYQLVLPFECQATGFETACRLVRSLFARGLVVVAVLALVIWARPGLFARMRAAAAVHPGAERAAAASLTGIALMALPLAWDAAADAQGCGRAARRPGGGGAVVRGGGGLLWLAPPAAWAAFRAEAGRVAVPAVALALVVPDLTALAAPLWDVGVLTNATFGAVGFVLYMTGQSPWADPATLEMGIDTFAVRIARECSGVEGLALVLLFAAVYAMLFRETLRQRRFWLIVVPLALATSWMFNVLRIAALIALGEHVSPKLAVEGFHSYAGWLFFTVLVTGILAVVQAVPGLQRVPGGAVARPLPPLRADPVAARIVPFAAFMLGSIVAAALFLPADLGYPVKALAMAGALWAFRAGLADALVRPDAVAVGAGLAVGLAWALTEPAPGEGAAALAAALGALPAGVLAAWVVVRVIGAVVLVPVVEELFFRGYVLPRLDRGGLGWRVAAVGLSSAAFAALHGRYDAAFLAGLVFAWVMLRRGRVADAVAAHVATNAMIAAFAAATGDWARL